MRRIISALLFVHLISIIRAIKIVDTQPSSSILVEEGGTVSFLCQADQRWFLCLWNSPRGSKVCAIQESEEGASQVCQGDPRIRVQGDSTMCGITISNVSRTDWGAWLCLVQDGEEFLTDRRRIGMEVTRRGVVRMEYGEESVGRVLRMKEGDLANISCTSEGGYPMPSITWLGVGWVHGAREGRYVAGMEESEGLWGNITLTQEVSEYCAVITTVAIYFRLNMSMTVS